MPDIYFNLIFRRSGKFNRSLLYILQDVVYFTTMTDSIIMHICAAFTPAEWSEVLQLAGEESPAGIALDFIRSEVEKDTEKLNRKKLHDRVFPNHKYRSGRISDLLKEVESKLQSFVQLDAVRSTPYLAERLCQSWLNRRGMFDLLDKRYRSQFRDREDPELYSQAFHHEYTLSNLEFYWTDLKVNNRLDKEVANHVRKIVTNELLQQVLSLKLNLVNMERISGETLDFPLADLILAHLDELDTDRLPVIRLLELGLRMYDSKMADKTFREYASLLETVSPLLDKELGHWLFTIKSNYLILRYNTDQKPARAKALLKVYHEMIGNDMLLWRNMLSYHTYLNIASIGLKCGETEWARQFIEDHQTFVEARYRNSAYAFNMARYQYHLGEYEGSLDQLAKVNLKEVQLYFAHKRLTALNYYYLHEWNALSLLLSNMQKYASRNQSKSYHAELRRNFINHMKSLLFVRIHPGHASNAKRKAAILEKPSEDHEWLMTEVEKWVE
ncbi:MAG: hypothetical protein GY751_01280 [Bacteroidetes bacterium]|nr:hypothetical protein [Bacteroidota bacterium]